MDEQIGRFPLLLAPAFAVGVALYIQAESEPGWLSIITIALLWLALAALLRRAWPGQVCMMLAVMALGTGTGKWYSTSIERITIHEPTPAPVMVEGVLVEIEPGQTAKRLRIRVNAIQGFTESQTPHYVRLSHRGRLQVTPGRAVRCRAILLPPPRPVVPGDYDFARSAWFEGLGAVGYNRGECRPAGITAPASRSEQIEARIGAVRRVLGTHVHNSAGDRAGGMAAAMISGDRSWLTPEDTIALRRAGLGHLLAISGLHIGLAAGLFYFMVRRIWPLWPWLAMRIPSSKAGAIAAIIATSLYLLLSGAAVSTQRAYIMVLVAMLAILVDRSALSLRSLALAMWIVTLIRPDTVVSPGYQMSFAASAALIALYESWPQRQPQSGRLKTWLLGLAASSLVASLATAPFAAYHFGRYAPLSVPANMLAMPIISLLSAPAVAIAAILSVLDLSGLGFAAMGRSLEMVLLIAHTATEHSPDRLLPVMPRMALIGFGLALAVGVICRGKKRALGIIPLLLAASIWLLSPQPMIYLGSGGTAWVKTDTGWVWWRPGTENQNKKGLAPLRLRDTGTRLDCRECSLETGFGTVLLTDSGEQPKLVLQPENDRPDLELELDTARKRGGIAVLIGPFGIRTVFGKAMNNRRPRRWDR